MIVAGRYAVQVSDTTMLTQVSPARKYYFSVLVQLYSSDAIHLLL